MSTFLKLLLSHLHYEQSNFPYASWEQFKQFNENQATHDWAVMAAVSPPYRSLVTCTRGLSGLSRTVWKTVSPCSSFRRWVVWNSYCSLLAHPHCLKRRLMQLKPLPGWHRAVRKKASVLCSFLTNEFVLYTLSDKMCKNSLSLKGTSLYLMYNTF